MLSIAIYTDNNDFLNTLKPIIQDFLIESKIVARVSMFSDRETLLLAPHSYDIYLMDMDSEGDISALGQKMNQIDIGSHLVFMSADPANAYIASKQYADFFLDKPIDPEALMTVLRKVRNWIRYDSIVVKTADGERRIRANNLNYINIVRRCLCYHLTDSAVFDGQTLRTSFEKAIYPLQEHESGIFYFLAPSLLINLGRVEQVNSDHVIFENGDVLYIPKKWHDKVIERWKSYSRMIN